MTRLEQRDPEPDIQTDYSFEQRWAHWQARGQDQDVMTHRRMQALIVAVFIGVAAVLMSR